MSFQPTSIIEDKVSRRFFGGLLEAYPTAFTLAPTKRYYLPRETKRVIGHLDFLSESKIAAQRVVECRSQNVFINYEEFTSGSTGKKKQCLRPSISWHIEFSRLRDLLDWAVDFYGIQLPWSQQIFYYSRYGKSSFTYSDNSVPSIYVEKYVYRNVELLFDRLEANKQPFILSGSPSSIIDLIDLGVDQFQPQIILLSGERCPPHLFQRIGQLSRPTLNLIVARELGLIGFQCPTTRLFHLFSRSLSTSRSEEGKLIMSDPANYLTSTPPNLSDSIDPLFEHICECGFTGLSTQRYEGRPYDKGYPAL